MNSTDAINVENRLLSRKQAAEILGVSPNTLAVWTCHKKQALPIVKLGTLVKYRYSDLLNFIERNVHPNTQTNTGIPTL